MNIRRFIGILGISILLSACADKKQEPLDPPKVLIEEEKMAKILSEVQLVEGYLSQIPYNERGNNDSDYVYFPLLFEKYQVSKADFLDNLAYYSQYEEKIASIYDKSIILLNKLKAKDLEIRLEMKLDSIRQDSINKEVEKLRVDSLKKTLIKAKKVKL